MTEMDLESRPPMFAVPLVRELRRNAHWYSLMAFVIVASILVYGLMVERTYRATTIIAPASSGGGVGQFESLLAQFGGIASLGGLSATRDSLTYESIAVLRSRAFTEHFLEVSGAAVEIIKSRYGGDDPGRHRLVTLFDRKIRSISQDRRSGLYSISVQWTNPEQAAVWANALVALLNEEMRTRAIAEASLNLEFLQREAASLDQVEVRQAIGRLIEAQVRQRMLASVTSDYAFRVVDAAIAPDTDDFVFPRFLLLGVTGLALGLLAVVTLAFLRARNVAPKS